MTRTFKVVGLEPWEHVNVDNRERTQGDTFTTDDPAAADLVARGLLVEVDTVEAPADGAPDAAAEPQERE